MKYWNASVLCLLVLLTMACGSDPSADTAAVAGTSVESDADDGDLMSAPGGSGFLDRFQVYEDDFDAMVERRYVRVAVAVNHTDFFIDEGRQRGVVAEALREFEKYLNKELKLPREDPLSVVAIPVARDQLLPFLVEGRADLAAASLTITPERLKEVDFSIPVYRGVKEVVVTGPRSPEINSLEDLAGQQVHVRRSSSYWESLSKLSAQLVERGLEGIVLKEASEYLEDEDLLEMVGFGLIPTIVVDDQRANFWSRVHTSLVVHSDVAVAVGGDLGWAIRPTATGLKEVVDRFARTHGQGTLFGNVLINRYLNDISYVTDPGEEAARQRFEEVVDLFRNYGEQYDFDYLLVTAQGFQESGLDQSVRSHAGAVGVMQLLPSTARDPAIGIPDIEKIDANVHAGLKYLRHVMDTYFSDPAITEENRYRFTFAAYNAGPNRIRQMRTKAEAMGLDPNVWFGNVEVATADSVGREPVEYVRQIFKYYVSYRLIQEQEAERAQSRAAELG